MNKKLFHFLTVLSLCLYPVFTIAQEKDDEVTISNEPELITVKDSVSTITTPIIAVKNNTITDPIEETGPFLLRPNDSSAYDLKDYSLAKQYDKLWLDELKSNVAAFTNIYQEVQELDSLTIYPVNLPTDTLKLRLNALDQRTPFNVVYNPSLERVIKSFLFRKRDLMQRMLTTSQFYFPMFEEQFAIHNIPLEMKYLAIVESALNPRARSRAGATGLWQFMYGTGKDMKLNISSYVDERSDTLKSTKAACKYLNRLYRIYKDWDLALAAYNSGPGNVNKAIRRSGGKRSYWAIRRYLPRETAGYVPAFLTTMYIMEYAQEHGLIGKPVERNYFETDTVHIKNQISFDQITKLTGVSKADLKILNPAYKLNVIPFVKGKDYALRLPVYDIGKFVANEDAIYVAINTELKNDRSLSKQHVTEGPQNTIRYKVKSGDFLGKIAEAYGVRVSQLKQWNGLRSNSLRIGQRLTIYPGKIPVNKISTNKSRVQNTALSSAKIHVVRSGDSLWSISRKYPGVTVEQLKKWNSLRSSNLKLGARLKLCDCS